MELVVIEREFKDRVLSIYNHKIDRVMPGDHIYIHEHGGLTNKHAIVIYEKDRHGNPKVVYYSASEARIVKSTLSEFAGTNCIRLALYGQAKAATCFMRKGTTFSECSMPVEDVVDTAMYFAQHPDEWTESGVVNESEKFALHCKMMRAGPIPISDLSHVEPGDHLCAKRLGGYTHHAIAVSGEEVVHFSADKGGHSKRNAKIRRDSIEKVCKNSKLYRYSRKHLFLRVPSSSKILAVRRRKATEIVANAMYYAENPMEWEKYELLTNNCEHFAFQMTFGGKFSLAYFDNQVRRLLSLTYYAAKYTQTVLVKEFALILEISEHTRIWLMKQIQSLEKTQMAIRHPETKDKLLSIIAEVVQTVDCTELIPADLLFPMTQQN